MQLHPLIEWLYELRGPSLKWELDTMRRFAAALGHPERSYRSVHVVGTNGKGSVAAMMHAIAEAGGVRAGLFTSPHLVCPTERIRSGASTIPMPRFLARLEEMRAAAQRAEADGTIERHPSFFETMAAIALVEFATTGVRLGVFETGLGGRLDATNVLWPEVTVLTSVGLDHIKSLGGSLESIAREKAGTIKPGIPVVTGVLPDVAERVVRRTVLERGAPRIDAARDVRITRAPDGRLDVVTPEDEYLGICPGLRGAHQARNTALAIRAAEVLRSRSGLPMSRGAIVAGIEGVSWPGRLERIEGAPTFLLDAAHNAEASAALADYLKESDVRGARPPRRILVFGLTSGREPAAMLGPLARHVDAVVACAPDTSRALPDEVILEAAASHHLRTARADGASDAVEQARSLAGPDGEVVGAGSLYLVGDLRRELLGLEGAGHARRELVPKV